MNTQPQTARGHQGHQQRVKGPTQPRPQCVSSVGMKCHAGIMYEPRPAPEKKKSNQGADFPARPAPPPWSRHRLAQIGAATVTCKLFAHPIQRRVGIGPEIARRQGRVFDIAPAPDTPATSSRKSTSSAMPRTRRPPPAFTRPPGTNRSASTPMAHVHRITFGNAPRSMETPSSSGPIGRWRSKIPATCAQRHVKQATGLGLQLRSRLSTSRVCRLMVRLFYRRAVKAAHIAVRVETRHAALHLRHHGKVSAMAWLATPMSSWPSGTNFHQGSEQGLGSPQSVIRPPVALLRERLPAPPQCV